MHLSIDKEKFYLQEGDEDYVMRIKASLQNLCNLQYLV